MLVLDTDLFSLLVGSRTAAAVRLKDRIRASGDREATTIVRFEEQMRGRLAVCHRATAADKYVEAAKRLHDTLNDFRIAAIVLAHDAVLLTRNLSDFRRIPRLRAEDWSA